MRMDTGREAFNTQIASNTVALVDRRIEVSTTASSASAVRVNVSAGEVVSAPVAEHRAADSDVNLGALATDTCRAYRLCEVYVPGVAAFVLLAVAGTAVAYSGSETPVYPTQAEVDAAVLAAYPEADSEKGWVCLGGIQAFNDTDVITVKADDSLRPFGLTEARKVTAGSELRTLTFDGYVADPGDAAAIPVTYDHAKIALTTGGSGETNTLADPKRIGQELTIWVDTDGGGNRVITAASAVNQAGNTVMTFADAGDTVRLLAISLAGVPKWRIVDNEGVALS